MWTFSSQPCISALQIILTSACGLISSKPIPSNTKVMIYLLHDFDFQREETIEAVVLLKMTASKCTKQPVYLRFGVRNKTNLNISLTFEVFVQHCHCRQDGWIWLTRMGRELQSWKHESPWQGQPRIGRFHLYNFLIWSSGRDLSEMPTQQSFRTIFMSLRATDLLFLPSRLLVVGSFYNGWRMQCDIYYCVS